MQSVKEAVLFSGGCVNEKSSVLPLIPHDVFVICADSGINTCEEFGFVANVVVGDFDSCSLESAKELKCALNSDFLVLNPIKDNTDTDFALDYLMNRGFNKIYLVGGLGSRVDHSLANMFLMEKCFKKGVELILIDENNIVHYLNCSSLELNCSQMKYVSIVPLENVCVSNEGFKYPLNNEFLYRDSSRGISNEIISTPATIDLHTGSAFVIESRD